MNFEQRIKLFKRAAARQGLFISSWLIRISPYWVVKGIMTVLLFVGFQLTIKLKRVARESLSTAFGKEKTPQEITQIIKKCFRNFGKGMIELIYYCEHPDRVHKKFTIQGREYLDAALSQGRGVVAVTAHFGNFPLMQMALAQFGYKVNVIIRKTRDEAIAEHVYKNMTKTGVMPIYTIPRLACVQESLKALRNNEILFILLDQHFGSEGGVMVDFFGQKAATATGPVVFADRAKAPILPIFNIEEDQDRHRIIIEPPFEVEARENYDEMLYVNISRLTSMIEAYVRRYPHEWGWMHRRWKNQPAVPTSPAEAVSKEELI